MVLFLLGAHACKTMRAYDRPIELINVQESTFELMLTAHSLDRTLKFRRDQSVRA